MLEMRFYTQVHICLTDLRNEKVCGNTYCCFSGELNTNDAFH